MNDVAVSLRNLSKFKNKLLQDCVPPERIWRGDGEPPLNTEHIIAIDYTSGKMYFKNELGGWTVLSGGGGGGGSSPNVDFSVENMSGWLSKTVAFGAKCIIRFNWSSTKDGIETGKGLVKISVGGVVKKSYEEVQGEIKVNVTQYLLSGENEVEITISDRYGNSEPYRFSITTVQVSIDSYFGKGDNAPAYTAHSGAIPFNYIPVGTVAKRVYFLLDGQKEDDEGVLWQDTTANNTQVDFPIPKQTHGSHRLEVYFKCEIDGQEVETDHLVYDLICVEEGNNTPIIASAFSVDAVKQYSTVSIPWIAYLPDRLTSDVTITDNFGFSTMLTVDRTLQYLPYKAENFGATQLSFSINGEVGLTISFPVTEYLVTSAETNALELYLTAKGRSNRNIENREKWECGNIKAKLQGFNFVSDGWLPDENGDTVLRVTGNARVEIKDYKLFGTDFRTTGKTIEFEFATRDILNPNATVIECWSGNRGLIITAQEALLKSELSEISRQYKEDEHLRVSFVVQKKNENRLLSLYINGVESACVQYGEEDDFSQAEPVDIKIGSAFCTTDIYCIRVYNNNLTRLGVLNNWIADTQNIDELVERAERNDIFDTFGNIDFKKITDKNIPCLVVYAKSYEELPDHKALDGEPKKIISGRYVDPAHPERSFTFENAEMDVQGTSSQWYERKNYKFKFKKGFLVNNVPQTKYSLRDTSMPTSTFTFKTDFASSEGANNVELVMLYDEVNPERTPPQLVPNSKVRQGIEGYPCLMFYYNQDEQTYHFIGKYNFNNDSSTAEVFGFEEGDESWEIRNNNDPTDMGAWKDDDYSNGKWEAAFKPRYPDENTDVSNLQLLAAWLKSTDIEQATNDELLSVIGEESVTYPESVIINSDGLYEVKAEEATYTTDSVLYRLAKFRNEFADHANVDAMIFNYVFTEAFLMVDNRRKNAFPTKYDEDGKWLILPYDFDTAIGINNNGELRFGYWLEDIDYVDGAPVFNGQNSVLYVNMRLVFPEKIKLMYQTIRKDPAFSYESIEERFANHQSVWGEAVFNEDSHFKYKDPLITKGTNDLKMLQGSKASQRKWWLYNRFRYLDSKYNTEDSRNDFISFYAYAKYDIDVTPYADIYAAAEFDSAFSSVRALRGDGETPKPYTIPNPTYSVEGEPAIDQVVAIFSASQLADVGDLSRHKIGRADFSKGVKLNRLKLGDGADGYENPRLNTLAIGNLPLLTSLDVRNCTALTQVVDVSGCPNIEEVLAEGSATTAVSLPNGGVLRTLHLPATVTNLEIRNQRSLTDFSLEGNDFSRISTLWLEDVDTSIFNIVEMLSEIEDRSRVRVMGLDITLNTAEEIFALYDSWDAKKFRGRDESGANIDTPVIEGVIHTGVITAEEYLEMRGRYPYIAIDSKNMAMFMNGSSLHASGIYDKGEQIIAPETTPKKASTVEHDFTFIGWSLDGTNVVELGVMGDENITYYAVYKPVTRVYDITWVAGSQSLTTKCKYGEVPEIPAKYAIGKTVDENGATYTIDGYTPQIGEIKDNTTFKVNAYGTVTRTMTARPTLAGARSDNAPDPTAFLADTGGLNGAYSSPPKPWEIMLYGFNFEELRNATDVTVADMNVFFEDSFSYKSDNPYFKFVRNFETSGNNYGNYVDLGDGAIILPAGYENDHGIDATVTQEALSKTIEWIGNNATDFVDGYTRNTFGMLIQARGTKLSIRRISINLTASFKEWL